MSDDDIYGFGRPELLLQFLPVHPHFYLSTTVLPVQMTGGRVSALSYGYCVNAVILTIPTTSVPCSPKCRHEYNQMECPTRYFCFCGKEEDPQFDPWLVPHSCGQVCGRQLKPECGHSCLLLCHPGLCVMSPWNVAVVRECLELC